MVNLNNTPISNTLPVTAGLGNLITTIPAGGSSVISIAFNQLFYGNPPTAILNQQTPGNFFVNPSDIAIIQPSAGGGVDLRYAPPGGVFTTVHFA